MRTRSLCRLAMLLFVFASLAGCEERSECEDIAAVLEPHWKEIKRLEQKTDDDKLIAANTRAIGEEYEKLAAKLGLVQVSKKRESNVLQYRLTTRNLAGFFTDLAKNIEAGDETGVIKTRTSIEKQLTYERKELETLISGCEAK